MKAATDNLELVAKGELVAAIVPVNRVYHNLTPLWRARISLRNSTTGHIGKGKRRRVVPVIPASATPTIDVAIDSYCESLIIIMRALLILQTGESTFASNVDSETEKNVMDGSAIARKINRIASVRGNHLMHSNIDEAVNDVGHTSRTWEHSNTSFDPGTCTH